MRNHNLNLVCGSRLDTDPIQLKANIVNLAGYVNQTLLDETASIVKKHNTFTSYCLKMLAYSTGHRPVSDMFAFREDIDLVENIVVINDKISNRASENRVCWFSSIANKQIMAYFKHLSSLSKFLNVEHSKLDIASLIYGLSDPITSYKQSAPLFFFLSTDFKIVSITPSLLLEEIKNVWPYIQDNHNRHCLENYLDRHEISSSLIDLQTGHQRNQNHLLGMSTSWTTAECAAILKPVLNHLTEDQGWSVIDGLYYESDISLNKSQPKPEYEFGHILRKTTRQENLVKLEEKIKDIVLGEVIKNNGIESYIQNIKSQENSIDTILSECFESENLSQNIIKIFINTINEMAKDNGAKRIKCLNIYPVEPSPFHDGWLHHYVTTRNLRNNFIQYLKKHTTQSKHDVEFDWAIIIISAVLFSGLFKYEWIKYILESGPRSLTKIKKWLYFIEIWLDKPETNLKKEYQSPNWRWFPDPLSRHLILRCLQNNKDAINSRIRTNIVTQNLSIILSEIGLGYSGKKDILKHLCMISEGYWIYHFPSFIHSTFQSKTKTRPLPQRTLARLCYKKRLSAEIAIKDKKTYVNNPTDEHKQDRNLKEYLITIRTAINTAKSKNKTNAPKQRAHLVTLINKAHKQYIFPNISIVLSQWLLHMIDYGATRGHPLVLKTINDYFFCIANPLAIYIGYNKIEEYDEEVISEIYRRVINYKNTDQTTRARQLLRFNMITTKYGLVDFNELDWSSIAGKWLSRKETRVDSNLVTPEEYYQSLDLIKKSNLDDYTKSWASIFLMLGYRFGLRIGEAHHIRWQDIQRLNNQIIVQVQRTIQGKKKTPAAIRQIPLMGALSTLEGNIFKKHLKKVKSIKGFNIKSHIFYDPMDTDNLLPRNIVWNVVHSVLRSITGDPRIRFHHLRHSFSTGQFISNLSDNAYLVHSESENSLWISYEKSINCNLINPITSRAYMMSALSCAIGHTKFITTLHSYIHLADDLAAGYARKAPFPNISTSELSAITGYKESTLKSRIRTKKLNKLEFSTMDVLATIQIGEEIPAYNFELEKFPKRLIYEIKKRSITINDIYDILLSSGVYNCSASDIAYIKCIEEKDIINIIQIAKNIEKVTKFDDFGLSDENDNSWFPTSSTSRRSSLNNEKTNIKNLFVVLERLLSNPLSNETLKASVRSWKNSIRIHNTGNALVFSNVIELSYFLNACYLLGYKLTHFNFTYPHNLSKKNEQHLLNNLSRIGIHNAKGDKIRRLESGLGEQRLNFVKSTLNKEVPNNLPKKLASLNQLLFILDIKFSDIFK
ncbi:MAG: site-specific integrase [Pseudomonadota bacterium]